jgi:hypothetical protein
MLTRCVFAVFWLAGAPAQAQALSAGLAEFLRAASGLDSAHIMAVSNGDAVVTVLDTEPPREIAVFGITAVALTRDEYLLQVLGFGDSTRPPTRHRFGVFGNPPSLDDVRDLTVSQRDVEELETCRPGACVMKLPAAAMTRLHEEIHWSAGDTRAQVSALARQALIEYVADYRVLGDVPLVSYDDRGNVHVSEAFADLLAATPQAYQYVPALQRHLTGYPAAALPDAIEVLYWSEDELPRLRPVLSVTHLVVYEPPDRPDLTLVAAKQIYANHYFEAAFDLTCFVDTAADGAGHGGYVVALRRYRFDRGPLNLRGRAVDAVRRQLLADLQRYQNR